MYNALPNFFKRLKSTRRLELQSRWKKTINKIKCVNVCFVVNNHRIQHYDNMLQRITVLLYLFVCDMFAVMWCVAFLEKSKWNRTIITLSLYNVELSNRFDKSQKMTSQYILFDADVQRISLCEHEIKRVEKSDIG